MPSALDRMIGLASRPRRLRAYKPQNERDGRDHAHAGQNEAAEPLECQPPEFDASVDTSEPVGSSLVRYQASW